MAILIGPIDDGGHQAQRPSSIAGNAFFNNKAVHVCAQIAINIPGVQPLPTLFQRFLAGWHASYPERQQSKMQSSYPFRRKRREVKIATKEKMARLKHLITMVRTDTRPSDQGCPSPRWARTGRRWRYDRKQAKDNTGERIANLIQWGS